jgi:hypothetical protein
VPSLTSSLARNWIPRAAPWLAQEPGRATALVAIKATHLLIFFAEELSVGYLLYAGLTKRQGRATVVAATAVAVESAIYLGNGQRCPLTGLADKLGAVNGSVTDIYLPRWIARRIFTFNAPLVALAALLLIRTFLARRPVRVS